MNVRNQNNVFSFDTVQRLAPESVQKMLHNIQKTDQRLKRNKETNKNKVEENEEMDEETKIKSDQK